MSIIVPIALGERSYDVRIEDGLIDNAAEPIRALNGDRPITIVTDEHVAETQLPRLLKALGGDANAFILPAGEATKSWSQLERLMDLLLEVEIERGDHLVALGGGVIGDLVGFAASILKRGCKIIQVPTTLLAQVDSSVGGKTAINARAGKNLVGTFHQPSLVLIDPTTLDTLPHRELRAGYAEVVKYGLISDLEYFAWCEANGSALLNGDAAARQHAIAVSVRAKADIVAADERETRDMRALLNLGHTFGHALEAATGFSERLLHGEAVAAGMALAFRFSASRGLCPTEDADRVTSHLAASGLPTTLADAGISSGGDELVDHMRHDKKMASGTLPFILAHGIGKAFVDKSVALSDVASFLDGERI